MASSTSSSAAGGESTPPAQVSAAPPPYLWLPSPHWRGDAGERAARGRGSRKPRGLRGATWSPDFFGCRVASPGQRTGTWLLPILGIRLLRGH
jgi:hypothetical protein